MLIIITFDRFMTIKIPLWNKIYLNMKKAFIIGSIVIAISMTVNLQAFFIDDFDIIMNKTGVGACIQT